MTFEEIEKNETIRAYISKADESLVALGYTEHSFAHVTHVAAMAGYLLETLGYDAHTVELAKIAGYLHDIGNLVNRTIAMTKKYFGGIVPAPTAPEALVPSFETK